MSHSTSEYLQQLQTDKQNLVDNLVTKGVNATNDETFTELVPKVLDISSGGDVVITDASHLFYDGARTDYLEEILNACRDVTSCAYMFYNCTDLISIDLSNFDTSNVSTMSNMFRLCRGITSIKFSSKDTPFLNNISYMFSNCADLENVILGGINTSKVKDMRNVFNACSNLTEVDLSTFDTSSVTRMDNMFSSCSKLIEIDLSNFDTSNVTNMANMFNSASALTKANISGFTSTRLTTNTYMFYNTKLTALIIDNPNLFKMTATSMLQNTPIASGTGYIYVPDDMVETYKSATNWSTYADQIKGMSELPPEEAQ